MSEHERDEEGKLKTPQKKDKTPKELGIVRHVHELTSSRGQGQGSEEDIEDYEGLSKEELAEKLAERETQLGAIALRAFEEEKKELAKALTNEYGKSKTEKIMSQVETPSSLEFAKGFLEKEQGTEEDPHKGTIYASGQPLDETGGQVAKQPSKPIDKLTVDALYDEYDKIIGLQKMGQTLDLETQKRKQQIEKLLDKLWTNVGKAFKQNLPARRFSAKTFTLCQKCGRMTHERICVHCGKETMTESEWARGR